MHYHVVRIEEGEFAEDVPTVARQDEAEALAAAMAREIVGSGWWRGRRYPGRSSRPQELAVYLDRRPLERLVPHLELAIIRCDTRNGAHGGGCWLLHRGEPD